jgi:hypothetical protein
MRKSYLVAVAGVLLMLGASAQAGGRGGSTMTPTTPHGFTSPGGHNGFETFTHTTPGTPSTSERLPGGWDEGKGGGTWKSGLQSQNPVLTTRPPGLSR